MLFATFVSAVSLASTAFGAAVASGFEMDVDLAITNSINRRDVPSESGNESNSGSSAVVSASAHVSIPVPPLSSSSSASAPLVPSSALAFYEVPKSSSVPVAPLASAPPVPVEDTQSTGDGDEDCEESTSQTTSPQPTHTTVSTTSTKILPTTSTATLDFKRLDVIQESAQVTSTAIADSLAGEVPKITANIHTAPAPLLSPVAAPSSAASTHRDAISGMLISVIMIAAFFISA
ncbi:hypothetical protein NA57DRAFT_80500 [Rhizodiscina lignyota]|uniref:Uncharacterized protein n=1 Tax=Rhizodiscina lignyota TaxID=1504668 RepID=A0A9P4I977_9PEZI|nr:hypothetical protein NA57DRAFT_80500 [Rhizodiscina lignyota]